MLDVNSRHEDIEVTANFIVGADLPRSHLDSVLRLGGRGQVGSSVRGTTYISPIVGPHTDRAGRRSLLADFVALKRGIVLPTYLYLIQRL
jgi:hypothetical protein